MHVCVSSAAPPGTRARGDHEPIAIRMMTAIDDMTTFADLNLRPELQQALVSLGYEEPTPIQQQAIPPLLQARDLMGQAATGTGKTAAFALPLLQRLSPDDRGSAPMALVLVPTRELAMQVSEAIHRYGQGLGARVVPVYGGQPIGRQLRVLQRGVDVVVATPGRALDHIARRTLRLEAVEVVVLDEADEMLDMGFADDIESILGDTPATRQTVLFSATMPPRIDGLARKYLHEPVRIQITRDTSPEGEPSLTHQRAYVVARQHKPAALGRLLDIEMPEAALIFCRTRTEVDELTETMNGRGYRAEALHGAMNQEQRDRVMGRLRAGAAELLVATDVAARGLDVEHLTHVVNYDVPSAPKSYVHRIGRVGRAGREGIAITLAEPRERRMLATIERVTKQPIAIERLPTVAELGAHRLERTRASLEAHLLEGDLEHYRSVVESLARDVDVMDVALAAVKLAHEASGSATDPTEEEIPEPPRVPAKGQGGKGRQGATHPPGGQTTRLFIGRGRTAGIRPKDLVGAITSESDLSGRDVGAIEIADRFSLVEVPAAAADGVIAALRRTRIKGKKATVRRDKAATRE